MGPPPAPSIPPTLAPPIAPVTIPDEHSSTAVSNDSTKFWRGSDVVAALAVPAPATAIETAASRVPTMRLVFKMSPDVVGTDRQFPCDIKQNSGVGGSP